MKIFWFIISNKTLIDSKPLLIRFDKMDGFNRIYDATRYLTLSGSDKIWGYLQQNEISYYSKNWYHIYFFSLFCENQIWYLWIFTYSKRIDFGQCYSTN